MKPIYKIFALLITLPTILLFYANSGGSPGGRTGSTGDGNQTCTACHTGTAIDQAGWITSTIPASGYSPGTTYTITVNGTHTGVVKFGFELTAENSAGQKVGTFTITEAGRTKLVNQNKSVTHTSGGNTPSGGSNSWSVNWTAPATDIGQIRFYAALNAANGNGGTSGDVIYKTNLFVNAMAPAALTAVSPSQADQGTSPTLTITAENTSWSGTNPVVQLRKTGTTNLIASASITVNSNTQLQALFNLAPTASAGLYDVLVNDLVLSSSFTIIELIPSLVSVFPNTSPQEETVVVAISSENTFWAGTTPNVSLSLSGSPSVVASTVNVSSNTMLTATFNIPADATIGVYDVVVNSLILADAFTITALTDLPANILSLSKIYPNPAVNSTFVESPAGSIIKVYDMTGKLLIEELSILEKSELNLSSLKQGMYLVEISHSNVLKIEKLLKR